MLVGEKKNRTKHPPPSCLWIPVLLTTSRKEKCVVSPSSRVGQATPRRISQREEPRSLIEPGPKATGCRETIQTGVELKSFTGTHNKTECGGRLSRLVGIWSPDTRPGLGSSLLTLPRDSKSALARGPTMATSRSQGVELFHSGPTEAWQPRGNLLAPAGPLKHPWT